MRDGSFFSPLLREEGEEKTGAQIIDTVTGVKVDTKSNLKIEKRTIEVLIDGEETVGYSYFLLQMYETSGMQGM